MVVNPTVDGNTKTQNHLKIFLKTKKIQPTENQKNNKKRILTKSGARF